MSAAGQAVELLMAARSRVLGAEDVMLKAFKADVNRRRKARVSPPFGDPWDEEFQERLQSLFERMVAEPHRKREILSEMDNLFFLRRDRYREELSEELYFRRTDRTLRRLTDLRFAVSDAAKTLQGLDQGFFSDNEEMVCDYVSLSYWAVFERPEEMTDEHVRELAGCLAEAREKVGAAADLVPSERLQEIRLALEVFRDEVLGTVER